MPHTLNYKHLHYFWTVAHEGSITKASKKLHITPQTISGQISLLEERVGNNLFDKSGRGLVLTDTGRLVLSYADDIFDLGKELSDVLRGAPVTGASEFIVSSTAALPKTIVYKIIEPSLNLPHEISLVSYEGAMENILADLAVHKTDLVLSDAPISTTLHIKAYNHYLGESTLSVFGNAQLYKKYQKAFPKSLHQAPMLLPTPQQGIRQDMDNWMREADVYPVIRGQFDDSALIKAFGQTGMGLFCMPTVIAEEVCRNFNVKQLGEIQEVTQKFYAISAERKVKHPAVSAVCDNARQALFD